MTKAQVVQQFINECNKQHWPYEGISARGEREFILLNNPEDAKGLLASFEDVTGEPFTVEDIAEGLTELGYIQHSRNSEIWVLNPHN